MKLQWSIQRSHTQLVRNQVVYLYYRNYLFNLHYVWKPFYLHLLEKNFFNNIKIYFYHVLNTQHISPFNPNLIQILKTKFILNPLKPNLTQISKSKTIQPNAFEDANSESAYFISQLFFWFLLPSNRSNIVSPFYFPPIMSLLWGTNIDLCRFRSTPTFIYCTK